LKHEDLLASTGFPAPVQAARELVVRAGLRRDGRDRPDPLPDRPGDQLDPLTFAPGPGLVGDRDRDRRAGPAGAERGTAAGRRPGVARGGARPSQPALRTSPAARAVLLRPPADGAAHVAG